MDIQVKKIHTFSNHSAAVYSMGKGRMPGTFFSTSGDKYTAEWDMASLSQNTFVVRIEQTAFSLLSIPEHHVLVLGNALGGLHVIDTESKKEVRFFELHTRGIYNFLWDARQQYLLAAGGDGCVSVWSLPSFELVRNIPFSSEKIRQMALSNDGDRIAIASGDGLVRIVETAFFNELFTLEAHAEGATSVAWHPYKPVLVTGGKDAHLHVFHYSDEGFQSLMKIPAHHYAIYRIAFSPDGKIVATASRDKVIKLWHPDTFDPLGRLNILFGGHTHSVNDLLWMDERHLLSCSDDRRIILWEITEKGVHG